MQFIKNTIKFNLKIFISCFLFGTYLVQLFYFTKNYLWLILIIFYLFYQCILYKFKHFKSLLPYLLLIIISIVAGFSWVYWHIKAFNINNFATTNNPTVITGTIVSLPNNINSPDHTLYANYGAKNIEFDFSLANSNDKLRIKWFNAPNNVTVGDNWQLYVKLKKPRNFYTPGSFDLEKYLFSKRIKAIGKVVNNVKNQRILSKQLRPNFIITINKFRQNLLEQLNSITKKQELNKKWIIFMLGLGIKEDLIKVDLDVFQNTGTAHLLAISGLHIGFVVSLVFFLVNILYKKFIPRIILIKLPSPIVAASCALVAAVFYASMTGLSIATIRALITTGIYLIAIICNKIIDITKVYLVSIMIILILDPFATLSSSFILSFWSVGILLYSCLGYQSGKIKLIKLLKNNLVMVIGLIPINGWFFGQISLGGYVANLVAVPWVNFLILPLLCIGLLLYGIFNLELAIKILIFVNYNLNLLLDFLRTIQEISFAVIELRINSLVVFLLSCFSVLWLLAPKGLLNRSVALVYLLPMFFVKSESLKYGEATISILDVGQGLAVVIKLQHHIVLYDVGPNNKVTFNYLKYLKYNKVDQAIISHIEADHVGGLLELVKSNKIKQLYTSQDYKISQLTANLCEANQNWELDGVKFEFIYPMSPNINLTNISGKNDNSCVLKMSTMNSKILFTGDISAKVEKFLVKNYFNKLQANILIVPHHGSGNSSSEEFIAAVAPNFAVISAGTMNIYGHPKPVVLNRYSAKKIKILNTIIDGTINFDLKHTSKLDFNHIRYSCYRTAIKNFWHYSN